MQTKTRELWEAKIIKNKRKEEKNAENLNRKEEGRVSQKLEEGKRRICESFFCFFFFFIKTR